MSSSTLNANTLPALAEQALSLMRRQGFEHAQVSISLTREEEMNIALNEPGMLRSTELHKVSLLGLVDGRKASTELADVSESALERRLLGLLADAASAPRDEANAVSAGQQVRIVQGPQSADVELLVDKAAELLAFRSRETPLVMLQEGTAGHTLVQTHTLTSGGSTLASSVGCYWLSYLGAARDGRHASSISYASGECNELASRHASEYFGIGTMLRDMQAQIHSRPLPGKFTGEVLLTPPAVQDLLHWLLGQLGDLPLITGSSLYRDRVGQLVASPLLDLRSRFDAPGVAAISADAFATPPVHVLQAGRLACLTPSLYGSRKTGLPHVPVAAGGGWSLAAGSTPLADMVASVPRGAMVGRLSMGMPAPNGDFSGVIKNSFSLDAGAIGPALSETMISGNVARMLKEVIAVSTERIDSGAMHTPWLRIGGLHFS